MLKTVFQMLHFIKQIKSVNNDFSVVCLSNTNEWRPIDLFELVEKYKMANDGWASAISDINYFKKVGLDSYGTLTWDNQLDFDPDVLYDMSTPA